MNSLVSEGHLFTSQSVSRVLLPQALPHVAAVACCQSHPRAQKGGQPHGGERTARGTKRAHLMFGAGRQGHPRLGATADEGGDDARCVPHLLWQPFSAPSPRMCLVLTARLAAQASSASISSAGGCVTAASMRRLQRSGWRRALCATRCAHGMRQLTTSPASPAARSATRPNSSATTVS